MELVFVVLLDCFLQPIHSLTHIDSDGEESLTVGYHAEGVL